LSTLPLYASFRKALCAAAAPRSSIKGSTRRRL
jgi:hypothetical protein